MKQLEKEYAVVLSQEIVWGDMDAFGHKPSRVIIRFSANTFFDEMIERFELLISHIGNRYLCRASINYVLNF